jgi:hypothetical protein
MWSAKFIILHFVYFDIETTGSPARMVYNYLKAFFKTENALLYQEVKFNFKDKEAEVFHNDEMKLLANKLIK